MDLYSPLAQLPRIGPGLQKKLKKLGLVTVRDLLFHFPHRYEDFSRLDSMANVKINQDSCVQGEIIAIETTRTWRKKLFITEALIKDATGTIKAVWFNRPYLTKILRPKDHIALAGKVAAGKKGIYFSNPSYEKLGGDEENNPAGTGENLIHTGRLVPVYPETEGLSSRWIRSIMGQLLSASMLRLEDTMPSAVQKEYQIMPLKKALWQVHFPDSSDAAKSAQESFAFRELFHISLFVLRAKARLAQHKAAAIPLNLERMQRFVKLLPFTLTDAQKKTVWQILKDLEKPRPMNRLLQGDVGSGKTVVALMAALSAISSGYQAAFMAPTEILAQQHFQTAANLLKKFRLHIGLLTGKTDLWFSPKLPNQFIEISRKKLLEKAKSGDVHLLIGTHTLIQDKVKFGNLALVILDEQHRFGVKQRAKLLVQHAKTEEIKLPHLLSMTATPIPRTLALTIYGDLDLSLLDELPKGRKKIITRVVTPAEREETYGFIREQIRDKKQVFVICPRIEGADPEKDFLRTETKAVKEEYEKLSKDTFPDLKVAMLHGKLPTKEKERIMRDFKRGKTNILISTSVVEVGVDIPNATVMMIEGAERFGLAQLHQFRGRVGRNEWQSYCFLFTDSRAITTRQRLRALVDCENGFELAERDLAIRGPGEFSGTRQWGIPDLIMNSLTDLHLVEKTRQAAKDTLMQDPYLKNYPLLKTEIDKFREKIHLE